MANARPNEHRLLLKPREAAACLAVSERQLWAYLISAKRTGTAIPTQTLEWLEVIDERLRDRLARAGLVESPDNMTLRRFDRYIDSRVDVVEATRTKWRITVKHREAVFDMEKPVRQFTADDANTFRLHLTGPCSATVAAKHYLQVHEEHFQKAAQFPAQQASEMRGNAS